MRRQLVSHRCLVSAVVGRALQQHRELFVTDWAVDVRRKRHTVSHFHFDALLNGNSIECLSSCTRNVKACECDDYHQGRENLPEWSIHKFLRFFRTDSLMLHEINELTCELKGPVERACRTIHIQFHCQIQKTFETLLISVSALRVVRKEGAKRKHIGHLGVMHLHVWTKLAGRLVWIQGRKTVDDVIRFRAVWHNPMSIKKIAPLDDDICDPIVVSERPIMKERIQQ